MTDSGFYMALVVLRVVQGVLTVLTNLLTVVSVLRHRGRMLRSPANIFIGNLALVDLLHGVVFVTLYPASSFLPSPGLCTTHQAIVYHIIITEMVGFLFIALERLINLRAQLRGSARLGVGASAAMATSSWVGCAIVVTLVTFLWGIIDAQTNSCLYVNVYEEKALAYVSVSVFLFVTAVTAAIYCGIICVVVKNQRCAVWGANAGDRTRSTFFRLSRRNLRLTKMLAVVVGVYMGLYIPHIVLVIVGDSGDVIGLMQAAVIISDINYWINPLIYAWKSSDFRKAFSAILGQRFGLAMNVVSPAFTSGKGISTVSNGKVLSVETASRERVNWNRSDVVLGKTCRKHYSGQQGSSLQVPDVMR